MPNTYRYKPNYRGAKNVPPDIVAQELARLEEQGALTASRVVEAARPRSAPLHAELEWDLEKAAHQHHLSQARGILRGLEVLIEPERPEESVHIRPLYLHLPDQNITKEGIYVQIDRLVEHPDEFQRALSEVLRFSAGAERNMRYLLQEGKNKGESIAAQVAAIQQGFFMIREALEKLREV